MSFSCFPMHLPQTSLEQLLHVLRVLLVQLLLWQCFLLRLFCILLLVILDSCELTFPSSTNLERSSSDYRKRYLCRKMFEPVTNLYKMWGLMAAKSNMLQKNCTGHLREVAFTLYFLAIWSTTSTPNFVKL